MKFYSDFAAQRSRQITVDVLAIAFMAAWIWLGVFVHSLVIGLTDFGVQMEQAGAGFRETMTDVGENLGGVPLIGGGIRGPFDNASVAGATLEAAGASQQVAVQNLALGLGLGIAVLPVLAILVLWLVPRLRFARRAATARRLVSAGAGLDLLALRALTTQRLTTLGAIDADPMAAWRRGDEAVMRSLAALELKSSGVRLT
ncbi:hypothetical protein GCM10027413_17660 [Conyzicola nivalis]|uniref:Uncharacterized protein n=1 Tax=Conyzicola nivalis TaxID=1477021 RepID=A0A916SEY9_9MICO|nr:hypothetical protein [Conyzicola nivalis]GGA96726.1 hypothetical protein GCM10010979_08960 [Conyzicola nivalis]